MSRPSIPRQEAGTLRRGAGRKKGAPPPPGSHRWYRPWTFCAVLWSLTIAWLMVLPSSSVEFAVSGWPVLLEIPSLDKILHGLSFGLMAWLWVRGLGEGSTELSSRSRWLVPLLLTVCYGIVLEGVQSLLPSRATQWSDILANSVGAAVAVSLPKRPRGPGSRLV